MNCDEALKEGIEQPIVESLQKVLGSMIDEGKDFDWICEAILAALCMQ